MNLPAPQILRVLKLYCNIASSHLPAPQILRLKLYYKVASSQLPQRVSRAQGTMQSLKFVASALGYPMLSNIESRVTQAWLAL